MIIDIGAGNTEIGIFEAMAFEYTNTIPLGGDNITKDIQMELNIKHLKLAKEFLKFQKKAQKDLKKYL